MGFGLTVTKDVNALNDAKWACFTATKCFLLVSNSISMLSFRRGPSFQKYLLGTVKSSLQNKSPMIRYSTSKLQILSNDGCTISFSPTHRLVDLYIAPIIIIVFCGVEVLSSLSQNLICGILRFQPGQSVVHITLINFLMLLFSIADVHLYTYLVWI